MEYKKWYYGFTLHYYCSQEMDIIRRMHKIAKGEY